MKNSDTSITKQAKAFLEGNLTYADLFSSFNKKYAEFGEWYKKDVVLCGFSSYAKKAADFLIDAETRPNSLTIVDTLGGITDYRGVKINNTDILSAPDDGSRVFIICTNPYMGFYAKLLREYGHKNIMTYHLLSLCDERFNYPLARYDAKIIRQYIEHYANEKAFYSRFINSLSDEKSKEIMYRLITYLHTLDFTVSEMKAMPTPYFDSILPDGAYKVFIDCGGYN